MESKVDVAIIGAGTAGLSAYKEVMKVTDRVVLINHGPYGTTCARVGCMPSKALIQVAKDFHRRLSLGERGINGGASLSVDTTVVMKHVRALRDRFVGGVLKSVNSIGERNLNGFARFIEPTVLKVDEHLVRASCVIIATGSRPVLPRTFEAFGDRVITSDQIFELQRLPTSLAVIGMGAIGLELGQSLARLGVEVTGFDMLETVGGMSDPEVVQYALSHFRRELELFLGQSAQLSEQGGLLRVRSASGSVTVDTVLASLGRKPNVDNMGLEDIGIKLDKRGIPQYDPGTLQVADLPLFVAGDVNGDRPILHEAADDGRVAGYNAVHLDDKTCFVRRAKLRIAFCEPNLAVVGESFADLENRDFAAGEVRFDGQGRALIMGENTGIIRVYAKRKTGVLLGAEMLAPSGEHLAHLLAWAIQHQMTVFDVLRMPFYHPVVEEGLRSALRDVASKLASGRPAFEMAICGYEPPSDTNS